MDSLSRDVAGFNIMSGGGPSLAIELALEWSRHQKPALVRTTFKRITRLDTGLRPR